MCIADFGVDLRASKIRGDPESCRTEANFDLLGIVFELVAENQLGARGEVQFDLAVQVHRAREPLAGGHKHAAAAGIGARLDRRGGGGGGGGGGGRDECDHEEDSVNATRWTRGAHSLRS